MQAVCVGHPRRTSPMSVWQRPRRGRRLRRGRRRGRPSSPPRRRRMRRQRQQRPRRQRRAGGSLPTLSVGSAARIGDARRGLGLAAAGGEGSRRDIGGPMWGGARFQGFAPRQKHVYHPTTPSWLSAALMRERGQAILSGTSVTPREGGQGYWGADGGGHPKDKYRTQLRSSKTRQEGSGPGGGGRVLWGNRLQSGQPTTQRVMGPDVSFWSLSLAGADSSRR